MGTVYVSTGAGRAIAGEWAGLELRYAGSWQLLVRVPRDQCRPCWWAGAPGRPRYLRVVLRDGSSHRSAELPAPASQCRVLQAQVLGALIGAAGVLLRRRFAWSAAARPVICLNASPHERSARAACVLMKMASGAGQGKRQKLCLM